MGFAYNDLIPAAILLDNPGITREEFVNLLDNTRSAPMVFKKDYGEKIRRARWDTYYPRWEDKLFHRGLHGLAGLLHLEQKPAFEELQKSKNDENGLELRPPFLSVVPHKKNNKWLPPKFTVTVHEKYVFSKIHEKHEESWHKLQKGELFSDAYYHMYLMRVEDIIKEKHTPTKRSRKSREKEYPSPEYNYHLKVRYVRPLEKTYRFSSLDELVKAHPQFHYDFMYDFSQERGALYGGGLFQLGDFLWKKVGDKYYLDKETFNRIRIGMGADWRGGKGYTDLIMTAEAIRNKAWKLLAYCGRRHVLDLFLKKFPESSARRDKAIWDAYTSLAARNKQMTHTEFLRWRITDLKF